MAVYICASFRFSPKKLAVFKYVFVSDIMKSSLRKIHNSVNAYGTDYFGSEIVNSDHLSFSLFTLILPPWALITCST